MKKVYVVTSGEYSDYGIERIFSTRELAEEYINGNTMCNAEEWDLDIADDKINKHYWTATIELYDVPKIGYRDKKVAGELKLNQYTSWELADRHLRTGTCSINVFPAEIRGGKEEYPKSGRIYCKSYISQEHANKIAVEAYQSWLRNGKPKEGFDFVLKDDSNGAS